MDARQANKKRKGVPRLLGHGQGGFAKKKPDLAKGDPEDGGTPAKGTWITASWKVWGLGKHTGSSNGVAGRNYESAGAGAAPVGRMERGTYDGGGRSV